MRTRAMGRRTGALLLAALALPALAGCATGSGGVSEPFDDELEEGFGDGATQPYEGPYGPGLIDQLDFYLDGPVVLTATVDEVLVTEAAFTIAAEQDARLPSLLVMHPALIDGPEPGVDLRIRGILAPQFSVAEWEQRAGFDLDDEALLSYESQPYVDATSIEPVSGTGD